jgi:hypothetical protein
LAIQTSLSSAANLPMDRRFEYGRYAAISAGATHQPRLQARERKVRSRRANQSAEIEPLAIEAPPHRFPAFTIAPRRIADLSADISRDGSTQRRNANAELHSALMPVYTFDERGGSNVSDKVSDPHGFKGPRSHDRGASV